MAKLLIVEDDESVRTLSARALERAGHSVDIAADGAQGLDRIRAAQGGYDLVVSDIRMPEWTASRWRRRRPPPFRRSGSC